LIPHADFRQFEVERIRRLILEILAAQHNNSLVMTLLRHELASRGYDKTPEFVLNQVFWLESEAHALRTMVAGNDTIATLMRAGRDHLERRRNLVGVHAPDDEG
jgi:hypothetical protein